MNELESFKLCFVIFELSNFFLFWNQVPGDPVEEVEVPVARITECARDLESPLSDESNQNFGYESQDSNRESRSESSDSIDREDKLLGNN